MALKKVTLDLMAADGLNQKIDLRRLPAGKSARALNLVKNKQGRLEKRLGFQPLTSADPFGSGFTIATGVNLGTWNQNIFAIGRGNWGPTGATVSALSQYSDDLPGMVRRGQVPDVKVVVDNILANTPTFAINPTMCIAGDLAVMVWLDCVTLSVGPQYGNVYWAAFELSTGDLIQAPTLLYTGQSYFLRLAIVNNTFIVCFDDTLNAHSIFCKTLTTTALTTGGAWVNWSNIITTAGGYIGAPFDMRAATGDSTDFVIAWEDGGATPTGIKVQRRRVSNPGVVDGTFVVNSAPLTVGISAIGVRADQGITNRCAVAYAQPATASFPSTSPYVIHAGACVYPSMAFEGLATNDTIIYTGADTQENYPLWLDVAYCGKTGQLSNNPTWVIAHTPWGAVWNNMSSGNGVLPDATGRIVTAAPTKSRCARIITNQFYDGVNAMAPWSLTSGANAQVTPGVTLASRGLEANGIIYYLGWVPSQTQGSFIAFAFDQAANPTNTGNGYPMRPVANLQVRTATSDPGDGSIFGLAGTSNKGTGPNGWTGASEWQFKSDIYNTSYVAYISGTIGQRMQPAYGAIQLTPLTGYPSVQWGSLAAIGGGLPCVFDGQNVFEQGFLWAPESVLVVMGNAVTTAPGPKWTNNLDTYSWIFTWEQFDAQGNFHISARSNPVTIQLTTSGTPTNQLGTAGIYNPTFYVPTLGATMRGGPATSNAFMSALPQVTNSVTLGVYRTVLNGSVYLRVTDRFFNGTDPFMQAGVLPPLTVNKLDNSCFVSFKDTVSDTVGNPTKPQFLDDPTQAAHPLLYGDGSSGAPGSLDNFCPPSSVIQVRHKERLFVARNNQVLYTKQRGQNAGPGYNEQVNAFFVGSDEPIVGMESMDDKLIIFKPSQLFYVGGDGPADDGSGSSFQSPQPIPTDSGCSDPSSIRSTPEGLYFMSTAGLRRLSRSLAVEYVGGPVEDELATYPDVRSVVLYPGQNRVVFAATTNDGVNASGEMIVRDYVLDAWTTAQVTEVIDSPTLRTPVALAVANAPSIQFGPALVPTLYFLTATGTLWRERDPQSAAPFFDNNTYVSWIWDSPPIKQQDAGRFRLWDIVAFGQSVNPHGIVMLVAIDDSPVASGQSRTWTWNTTGGNNIAPGGVLQTGLTRMRNYDGRFGTSFQVRIQDVSDPLSTSGQGLQLLGLSLSLGVAPGPYKLPPSTTQ